MANITGKLYHLLPVESAINVHLSLSPSPPTSLSLLLPPSFTQVVETSTPGQFTLWALVGEDLHQLKLTIPRVFYVNCRTSKELKGEGTVWRRVSKFLPRSSPVFNLNEYCVSEEIFMEHAG